MKVWRRCERGFVFFESVSASTSSLAENPHFFCGSAKPTHGRNGNVSSETSMGENTEPEQDTGLKELVNEEGRAGRLPCPLQTAQE